MQARAPSLLTSVLAWVVHKLMSLPIRYRELTSDELAGRDYFEDLLEASVPHSRELNPEKGARARDTTNGRIENARNVDTTNAFMKALLNARDLSSDELAGRSWLDDTMNLIIPASPWPARSINEDTTEIMARDNSALARSATDALIKALMNTRDLSSDELAGRDFIDDFLDTPIEIPPSGPNPHARSNTDGLTEIMARDDDGSSGSATDDFIKALMSSRSEEITHDEVMTLASLASRALDELD